MDKNKRAKPLQTNKPKELRARVRHVRDIASARSLLSYVIAEYQRGNVTENYSKTIAYLLNQYANLFKIEKLEDFEKRLENLENEQS